MTLSLWNGKNPILSFEIKNFYFKASIKESWMNLIIRMGTDSIDWNVDLNKFTLFEERILVQSIKLNFLFFFFDNWLDIFIENKHFTIIFFKKLINRCMDIQCLRIRSKLELWIIDNLFQLIRQNSWTFFKSKGLFNINQMWF